MATTTTSQTSQAATAHRVRLTLVLDSTPYTVHPIPSADLPPGAIKGFVLSRTDRRLGKVQHRVVEAFEGPSCNCGDQTYRQSPTGGICKHIAAAQACGLL